MACEIRHEPFKEEDSCATNNKEKIECEKLYTRRWLVLVCYCLLTLSCFSGYFVFTSVSKATQRYYGVSLSAVNYLTITYESASPLLSIPFAYFTEKYGIGAALVVSSFLDAAGAIVRLFGARNNGYWFLLCGGIIRSCSVSGYLFLPPKIASVWFGPNERGLATAICVSVDAIGMALGLVQSAGMIHDHNDNDLLALDFLRFLISQAVFASFSFFFIGMTVKDSPRTPPSRSQALAAQLLNFKEVTANGEAHPPCPEEMGERTQLKGSFTVNTLKSVSYRRELLALLCKRQFLVILVLHAMVYTMETIIITLLNAILTPKFQNQDLLIGVMGAIAVLGSTIGNLSLGPLIDRTKHYVRWAWAIFTLTSLFTILFTVFYLYSKNFGLLFVTLFVMETTNASFYTLAFELGAEATYPIPESSSAMLLVSSGQTFGIIMTAISSKLLIVYGAKSVLGLLCAMSISSLFVLKGLREVNIRTDIDRGE